MFRSMVVLKNQIDIKNWKSNFCLKLGYLTENPNTFAVNIKANPYSVYPYWMT